MPPTGDTGIKPTLSDDPLEERSPRSRRLGGASKSVHRCNAWGLYKFGRYPSEGARGFERPTGTGRPGSSDFLVSLDKKGDLEWLLNVERSQALPTRAADGQQNPARTKVLTTVCKHRNTEERKIACVLVVS